MTQKRCSKPVVSSCSGSSGAPNQGKFSNCHIYFECLMDGFIHSRSEVFFLLCLTFHCSSKLFLHFWGLKLHNWCIHKNGLEAKLQLSWSSGVYELHAVVAVVVVVLAHAWSVPNESGTRTRKVERDVSLSTENPVCCLHDRCETSFCVNSQYYNMNTCCL